MFKQLKSICEYYNNEQEILEDIERKETEPYAKMLITALKESGCYSKAGDSLSVTIKGIVIDELQRENKINKHASYGIVGYTKRMLTYHGLKDYIKWDYTSDYKAVKFSVVVSKVLEVF